MATVTGTLKDFTPQPLGVSAQAQIVFTPMGPAGNTSKALLVSKEIRVSPASDGTFSVTLATYGSTNPSTAYRLRVEWFDSGGNYLSTEEIPWAVVVTGDGSLVDFFADVKPGKLLVKGDKGDSGNAVQQAAIDALTLKNTEQDGRLGTIEGNLVGAPLSRGILPDGTDLNTLTGPDNAGTYGLLSTFTYLNAPPLTSAAVLEVQRASGSALTVVHRVTSGAAMFWREAVDASLGSWPAWVQAETRDRADAKNAEQDTRLVALEKTAPKVSNIAIDTDGNPYYSPGSTEVLVIPDGDGVPYYMTFLQASADADGTPYF